MHWHVPRNLQVSATSGIAAEDVSLTALFRDQPAVADLTA